VVAPTGGFGVRCNAGPNGVLPLGTCSVIGFTINTLAGSLVESVATSGRPLLGSESLGL